QVACRRMRVAQPVESSRCGSRDSRIRIRHATAVLAAQRHRPRGSVAPTRDDAADAADETDPDGASGGFCAGSYRSSSARTEYGSAHRDEYVVITGLPDSSDLTETHFVQQFLMPLDGELVLRTAVLDRTLRALLNQRCELLVSEYGVPPITPPLATGNSHTFRSGLTRPLCQLLNHSATEPQVVSVDEHPTRSNVRSQVGIEI